MNNAASRGLPEPAMTNQLTPALRAEIEQILTSAGDDNRHAMAFRGLQQGLGAEQIAKEWDRSKSYAIMVMRSVRYLLDGELPRASSRVLTTSYVYRALLAYHPSDALRGYAMACLRELHARNPETKVKPMGQVFFQDHSGSRKPTRQLRFCPKCFLSLPCECE